MAGAQVCRDPSPKWLQCYAINWATGYAARASRDPLLTRPAITHIFAIPKNKHFKQTHSNLTLWVIRWALCEHGVSSHLHWVWCYTIHHWIRQLYLCNCKRNVELCLIHLQMLVLFISKNTFREWLECQDSSGSTLSKKDVFQSASFVLLLVGDA